MNRYDAAGNITAYREYASSVYSDHEYLYDADGYITTCRDLQSEIDFTFVYEDMSLEDALADAADTWSRGPFFKKLMGF